MSQKPWKTRPGKCPSRCDRGTLVNQCKRTCEKTISHGTGRDEDGKLIPGGKMHDCGKH
jgi:hypothetical protein